MTLASLHVDCGFLYIWSLADSAGGCGGASPQEEGTAEVTQIAGEAREAREAVAPIGFALHVVHCGPIHVEKRFVPCVGVQEGTIQSSLGACPW